MKERMSAIGDVLRTMVLAVLVAAALVAVPAVHAAAEVVDRVVAVVNDRVITLSELNAAYAVALGGLKGSGLGDEDTVETRSKVLDNLIERTLIKQAAEKAGIEVSEWEIDNAIEDVKRQNNLTHEALMVALASSGLTYNEYREQMRDEIRQVKFVNRRFRSKIVIQDEDVEEYYTQHIDDYYTAPSFRLRILFLSSRDRRLLELRLKAVMKGLNEGEEFSELVRQYSEGPAVASGGDIGYLETGEVAPVIEEAANRLEEGEVSGPITTPEGVYLIQLVDRKEGEPQPLEEVKDSIRKALYKKILAQRYNFWLEETKKIAYIEVRL